MGETGKLIFLSLRLIEPLPVKREAHPEMRAALVVVQEAFAVAVEELHLQIDAEAAREDLAHGIGQIELNTTTIGVTADPTLGSQLESAIPSHGRSQQEISAIQGDVRIVGNELRKLSR